MAERARLLGGTLEVESTPGLGDARARPTCRTPTTPRSPPAGARVRLLIADDHEAIRIGIARLLADVEPSIEVVGHAGSGREALALWRALRPDVVADGPAHARRRRRRGHRRGSGREDPEAAIVALTAFDHDELVAGALRAGARGYLGKDASRRRARPRRARRGPRRRRSCRATPSTASTPTSTAPPPSPSREREVFSLLERGLPDRQIADALSISVKTVEKHVGAILRKTGARTAPRPPCGAGSGPCGRGIPHRTDGGSPRWRAPGLAS